MSNAYIGSEAVKGTYIGESIVSVVIQNISGTLQPLYQGYTEGLILTCSSDELCVSDYQGNSSTVIITPKAFYNQDSVTGIFPITSIRNSAFLYNQTVANITIPGSVTSIGEAAFLECHNLANVTISEGVKSIGGNAFYNCSSLTNITVPDSVTDMGSASVFYNCSSLTSVTIGNGATTIGSSAFYNCSNLTNATIGSSVTAIGYQAFYNCSNLTNITIPNSVTSIGSEAFSNSGCVTTLNEIQYVDHWCILAANSNIVSKKLDVQTRGIADHAFAYCRSLVDITIPGSMMSTGNGVTSIGSYAFYYCSSLTRIDFEGTMAQWNAIIKGASWDSHTGNYKVYCTDGTISK